MEDKILDAPQNGLSKKLFALRKLLRITATYSRYRETQKQHKR